MSEAAANSTSSTHPAQEFFDYAEASTSMKAGAFLSLVDRISIPNLEDYGSIATVFAMSSGFCYGHMHCTAKARNRPACRTGVACQILPFEIGGQHSW